MPAFEFLKEWSQRYPQQAALLLGGLALFATVAAARTFINFETDVPAIVFALGACVVVFLITGMLNDRLMLRVLQWSLLLIGFGWFGLYVAYRSDPKYAFLECLALPLGSCRDLGDGSAPAAVAPPALAAAAPIGTQAPATFGKMPVFMQFAGFNRNDIRVVMNQLASAGWDVQGLSGGGQRTAAAAGTWEIRYSGADDAAARALAATLQQSLAAAKLPARSVPVVRNAQIAPDTLEIWISQ